MSTARKLAVKKISVNGKLLPLLLEGGINECETFEQDGR